MTDKAHITNIEALGRFRSHLVLFVERANMVLDEVSEEVKRTRIWLQSEQRLKLGAQLKRKTQELEQFEQELFTARLSPLKTTKTGQQMQINKKRREIKELEDTLRSVTGWLRNFDSTVEVEARKVEKLRQILDHDMGKALKSLAEAFRLLQEYQSSTPPASS